MNADSRFHTRCDSSAGKLGFISGGSSGIGAELVRAFAAQRASVAFCGIRPEDGEASIDEVVAAGHPAPWYAACDARDIPPTRRCWPA